MNRSSRKVLITLASLALLLFAVVGTTAAYLYDKTDRVNNTFDPAQVSCAVVENGSAYTASTVTVSSKSNVTVKNTGNIPAYIRAAILVSWKSSSGIVYGVKPTGQDYTLQLNSSHWSENGGFYYYNSAVPAGGLTEALITSAAQTASGPIGPDGTQYSLSIEIVAEAIQADGMGATSAQAAWAATHD